MTRAGFLAILDSGPGDAARHVPSIEALVRSIGGTVSIEPVSSRCTALAIDVTPGKLDRLIAALSLGGATVLPTAPKSGAHCTVLLFANDSATPSSESQ